MKLRNEIKLQSSTGSIKLQNHLLTSDCSLIFTSITKAKNRWEKEDRMTVQLQARRRPHFSQERSVQ